MGESMYDAILRAHRELMERTTMKLSPQMRKSIEAMLARGATMKDLYLVLPPTEEFPAGDMVITTDLGDLRVHVSIHCGLQSFLLDTRPPEPESPTIPYEPYPWRF